MTNKQVLFFCTLFAIIKGDILWQDAHIAKDIVFTFLSVGMYYGIYLLMFRE